MTDRRLPAAPGSVSIHLLDSSQGHTLQSWRISDRATITIGRNDDNDVVIADPHVSRLHVSLVYQDGDWTLNSHGRHGTMVGDRMVAEMQLKDRTIFRLGSNGPTLRFDLFEAPVGRTETLDRIDPEMLSKLDIDHQRKAHEVEQITDNALFRQLLDQSRQYKARTLPRDEAK
jgi:pSer/pThr/pTyr-binding forkhead associated (FHA) protein